MIIEVISDQGEILLLAAGIVQIILVIATMSLHKTFNYKETLATLPTFIRQLFRVQSFYIALTLLLFSLLCIFYAPELLGGSGVGVVMSIFMAIWWGIRIPIQLFYYDPELRREKRIHDIAMTLALIFLRVRSHSQHSELFIDVMKLEFNERSCHVEL